MKVKAIKKGFYKTLRRVDDEFILTSRLVEASKSQHDQDIKEQFSKLWMVDITPAKPKPKPTKLKE